MVLRASPTRCTLKRNCRTMSYVSIRLDKEVLLGNDTERFDIILLTPLLEEAGTVMSAPRSLP